MSELAVTEEELKQMLASATFTRAYGFTLHSFELGRCTLNIPFHPGLERPGGIVAGPVFIMAADVAMWLAIMTYLGKDIMTVSTEVNTAFLNAAKQEDARCSANVLKLGGRIIYGTAECTNRDGKLFTHHTLSYIRIK